MDTNRLEDYRRQIVRISPAGLRFTDLRDFSLIKNLSQPKLG